MSWRRILAGLVAHPWGQVSPSVYETARLVSLTPGLAGRLSRVDFLVGWGRASTGRADPGAASGYELVPLLSTVEALLAERGRGRTGPEVLAATRAGLTTLFRWLGGTAAGPVPDTPAIELIVPALVAAVNGHLAAATGPGLDPWRAARLPLPPGLSPAPLDALRARARSGVGVPAQLLHSLEVLGPDAAGLPGVVPVGPGTVGASPAATAAWLGDTAGPTGYLRAVVAAADGAVPSVLPVTAFERAWVLASLADAGARVPVPAVLLDELAAGIGPDGTPGGAGLPPDADTTSVALTVLHRAGRRVDPSCLRRYRVDGHYCAWPGERTASPTVNAHVLEALLLLGSDRPRPARAGATRAVADRAELAGLAEWLAGQQRPDGSWTDKWHASPYYATADCARVLDRLDTGPSTVATGRAVRYVLDTQRADGSWGRWAGTAEETAYALRLLLRLGRTVPAEPHQVSAAAAQGYTYLRAHARDRHRPLWHDKDLYRPSAVVAAAVLGALTLAARDPVVGRAADRPDGGRSDDGQGVRRPVA